MKQTLKEFLNYGLLKLPTRILYLGELNCYMGSTISDFPNVLFKTKREASRIWKQKKEKQKKQGMKK